MEILILGCGKLAKHLVPTLVGEGHQVTLLDRHQECLTPFSHQTAIETVQITGTTLMGDLRRGGIDGADAFIALSQDDNENAMAAQIASHIFNVPQVVCHIGDVTRYDAYQRIDLNVVCSTVMVTDAIRRALRGQG